MIIDVDVDNLQQTSRQQAVVSHANPFYISLLITSLLQDVNILVANCAFLLCSRPPKLARTGIYPLLFKTAATGGLGPKFSTSNGL